MKGASRGAPKGRDGGLTKRQGGQKRGTQEQKGGVQQEGKEGVPKGRGVSRDAGVVGRGCAPVPARQSARSLSCLCRRAPQASAAACPRLCLLSLQNSHMHSCCVLQIQSSCRHCCDRLDSLRSTRLHPKAAHRGCTSRLHKGAVQGGCTRWATSWGCTRGLYKVAVQGRHIRGLRKGAE